MIVTSESLLQQLSTVNHANTLLLGGVAFITVGLWRSPAKLRVERMLCGTLSLLVLGIAAIFTCMSGDQTAVVNGLFVADEVTRGGAWLAIIGGVLLTLLGWDQMKSGRAADQYGCVLLMLSGLIYASAANDLTSLFLGLELVSIPTTVLLSMSRGDAEGREATLKYFTLAAFASGIFLLGCSYLYGLAGSTFLPAIYKALSTDQTAFAHIAVGVTFCGLCFRVTAVPFHFYAPDVFAGSTPQMAASMSLIPKVAGFVAIIRLLGGPQLNEALAHQAIPLILVVSAVTMTLGNCAALVQTRLRRMLAYSSISHSGYMLLAIAALLASGGSTQVVFDYMLVYAAMTMGVFAIVTAIEDGSSGSSDELSQLNGLYFRRPWLAAGGTVCLLSLTGLPLTAGFWAKIQVFLISLVASRFDIRVAAILMAINATIAAVYYLSLVYRFFQPSTDNTTALQPSLATSIACGLCSTLTVIWFFFP